MRRARHAHNLFPAMGRLATVTRVYQTYPHVGTCMDRGSCGRPFGFADKKSAHMASGHRPHAPHVTCQSSLDSPNKEYRQRQRDGRQGALAASLFRGIPARRHSLCGSPCCRVTDGDAAMAQALCDELLAWPGAAREKFVYQVSAGEIAAASQICAGGRVLLDTTTNCCVRRHMDTMAVLGGIRMPVWRRSRPLRSRSAGGGADAARGARARA